MSRAKARQGLNRGATLTHMGAVYYVYIAELANGWLYVGVTKNLDRRAVEHELGRSIRTTRIFGFKQLLYTERHATLALARRREIRLKKWSRAKKLALAAGNLAELKRLAKCRRP
jgi:putative endonuclease